MAKSSTSGQGRPKGIPNKHTESAREAIAQFVDGNAHRLTGWLDEVALTNPEKAFQMFQSVVEYHIPKLARTDTTLTGADGGPVKIEKIEVVFGRDKS
jgi:hypothetical protein